MTGVACTDLDGNLTLVNQTYCDITGYSADELRQRRMQDITHPEDLPRNIDLFLWMRTEGTPFEIEKRYIRKDGSIVWVNNSVSVIRDRDGNPQSAVAIVLDITERKQAALNAEFLAAVTQDLVEVTCVEDIIQTVGKRVHRYFQVSICAFVEIDESAELATVDHCWHQENEPSLVGVYHLPEFVTAEFFQAAKLGQAFVVRDVKTDPRIVDPERLTPLKIGSLINIPLIRDGEWKFTLGIYRQTPYNWRSDEIELMRELASRIWTKLESARAEAALRESEAKYRSLFQSIDEGYAVVEVLADDNGEWNDFLFLEVNSAFEQQTGMVNSVGRKATEILGTPNPAWAKTYGQVAQTGEPMRFEQQEETLDRIFDLYAFRLGEAGSRFVAVLFNDITERKRREAHAAFLAEIGEDFSRLSTANEIMQTVGAKIGAYLKVTTCNFTDVDEARDRVTAHHGWSSPEVPSTVGTFRISQYLSKEFERASWAGETVIICNTQDDPRTDAAGYAALNMHSFVTVPFHRDGRWTHYIAICDSRPRNWRDDEIQLIEEISNRIFPRLERARAEAALRAADARLRAMADTVPILIWETDETGVTFLNRYYLDFFGASFERVCGMGWARFIHPEDAAGYEATWREALARQQPYTYDSRFLRADGQYRWLRTTGQPISENRLVGCSLDITDSKRREANLALLAEVAEAFSQLSTAQDIIQTVGAKLGAYLNLATCHLVEIDEAADRSSVLDCWRVPEAPELAGIYRISDFLTPEIHHTLRAGETVAVSDTLNSSLVKADAYAPTGIQGFVTVPFHRFGEWKYLLSVTTLQVRNWQDDEIELIQELSNRLFPRLERARAEASLRESEEQFRTVTATVPQLIWTATPDGRVDYLSDQWADYVGLAPEQLYGWSWQQVTHPDDLPNTVREWQHCLQSGEPLEVQHRFRHRTGEWRWQLVRGIPIKDATGNVKKWVGTCTDIQSEVDIKEALRESEAKYRSLFDSIDEGFCIIEVLFDAAGNAFDYRFLEANAALEKHTGLVDVVGKTVRELVPNMEPYWYEAYGEVALTGIPKRFENTAERLERFYDVYAFRMGEPQECKVAVLFNDISERKQAEQDLRESEEWARIAIQVARLGGWRLHLDTSLVEMDERMREIWGEPEDGAMVPLPQVMERMHPDDRERVANAVNSAISPHSTGIYEIEYRIVWNDGTERWVLAKGQAQFEGEGECRRTVDFFGTLLDITDRKQAEVEREQLLQREQTAREEAEQANRIKDEFLAVLSHELRSPLNPILGWTRLLQNGKLDQARQREALATIERNARLQTQLIEDLLDISRIIRGKLSLTVAPVNLTFVITAAVETVRLAAEAKQIQILLDLTTAITSVSGDAARLQQVVWNLLSNAVKFTPNGGQVTVELRQINQLAQIQVIDTGKGIFPDFLPHVFDYFRQADATTTRKFGGLGLGLAIVKQIVEMHGGNVKAESPGEDQGATFTVQLPVMQHHLSPVLEPSSAKTANQETPLNNLQILVVDDDDDTREFQAFLLEQNGARVTAVTSGLEALEVLDQCIPDVLVSDVGMAQMDGYMLIQQIRSRPCDRGGTIPAIALTAYAAEVDQQKALQAGFQTHITKPVDPEALLGAIVSLLRSDL